MLKMLPLLIVTSLALAAAGMAVDAGWWEPRHPIVERSSIQFADLPAGLDGLRLAHLDEERATGELPGEVHDDGVAYRGQRYRSLSEVARLITGTRWSGPLFFGLRKLVGEARDGAA